MPDSARIQRLRDYLNHKARITISDGRIFIGHFVCIDKGQNTILAGAEEFKNGERRFVGLIMVPGKHLIKAEFEVNEEYI
ncbi:hypothetical protein SpCBS45565_g05913 [Spizellomyces sp. 'palustris']|nr:hypothetical protein SpCBS45565_g05913 [Spizellomyces sp. 'palustris']